MRVRAVGGHPRLWSNVCGVSRASFGHRHCLEDGPVESPQRTTRFHDPETLEHRGASGYSAALSANPPSTTLLRMGNKASERYVYDYVDACVRDEPRDASAMHRQFSIFGNSAVNASLDILRASPGGMTMKRLRMVLACLVCLGMAAVSGSAAA